jgi:hypothetical protein
MIRLKISLTSIHMKTITRKGECQCIFAHDGSLAADKFLKEQIAKDTDGYVNLDVIARCARYRQIRTKSKHMIGSTFFKERYSCRQELRHILHASNANGKLLPYVQPIRGGALTACRRAVFAGCRHSTQL